MPPNLFDTKVTVYRATSSGRDALNNPTYGTPVTGAGWSAVYTNMPASLRFSTKEIRFAITGEHPDPGGIVYVPGGYTILPDDRIVTSDVKPIQYVVTSVVIAYKLPGVVDHYEVMVKLPI